VISKIKERRMSHKPIIGITMGDPAGIGPELIVKALSNQDIYGYCNPFAIADPKIIEEISKVMKSDLKIRVIRNPGEAVFSFGSIDVLCPEGVSLQKVQWGKVDAVMGKAAAVCEENALKLALEKKINGIVFGPLNKEAFHLAGYHQFDNMEYWGEFTNTNPYVIGVMDAVWTLAITGHIPFRDIADQITKELVLKNIKMMDATMRKSGFQSPRIAVAALNVHGGEGGNFGSEERDEIRPAVEEAKKSGVNAQGPFPADTVLVRAIKGEFDGVIFMYHDQANIARKMNMKKKGASIYIGLPVNCASTPHGTAFDIAGKGIADEGCLKDALKVVASLAARESVVVG
jgi:4-phospho-D-threonate 3-dehydrogenase / 4-phospho-D-erythronate 3-dehydrogenase